MPPVPCGYTFCLTIKRADSWRLVPVSPPHPENPTPGSRLLRQQREATPAFPPQALLECDTCLARTCPNRQTAGAQA